MSATDFVQEELRAWAAAGRLRIPETAAAGAAAGVDVSSNDYLGLARRGVSRETLDGGPVPAGAGASRLVFGTVPDHDRLEAALAAWLAAPTALLFSSGYAANLGVLTALAGPGDLIVSDALNHASLVDGCRLSRATVAVTPHRDVGAVAAALARPARRRFVVTEAYFSMDGDGPDLAALAAVAQRANAVWILDEAHSLGVFGPQGRGLAAAAGVTPDVLVGTLGKAFGLHGAFVATSAPVRAYLWNRARSFVYSTATSPVLARLALTHLDWVRAADDARAHLHALARHARARIRAAALASPADRDGPILPVLLGSADRAQRAADGLRAAGFLARAIRPPTVPVGTDRLRLVLHADLAPADLDALLDRVVALAADAAP